MVLRMLPGATQRQQCEIVGIELGKDACGDPARHNMPLAMQRIEALYLRLDVKCVGIERQLQSSTLVAEVLDKPPVQVRLSYGPKCFGHVVLVIGDKVVRGQKFLKLADPFQEEKRFVDIDSITDASGKGTWVWTWYRFEVQTQGEP